MNSSKGIGCKKREWKKNIVKEKPEAKKSKNNISKNCERNDINTRNIKINCIIQHNLTLLCRTQTGHRGDEEGAHDGHKKEGDKLFTSAYNNMDNNNKGDRKNERSQA